MQGTNYHKISILIPLILVVMNSFQGMAGLPNFVLI